MAKKPNATANQGATTAPVTTQEAVESAATPAGATTPAAKPVATRGPRGVAETAKITLVKAENPKRPGSKAHEAYANYKDQMTVAEFCDAVGKDGTPHLVYDTAHGFITIEGYVPPKLVPVKEKVAKAPKEPKATKSGKAVKDAAGNAVAKTAAEVDEQAAEETLD